MRHRKRRNFLCNRNKRKIKELFYSLIKFKKVSTTKSFSSILYSNFKKYLNKFIKAKKKNFFNKYFIRNKIFVDSIIYRDFYLTRSLCGIRKGDMSNLYMVRIRF